MSRRVKGVIFCIVILAAALGVADSGYLTLKHFADAPVVCRVVDGCSVVLESSWSEIFGIPTALIGLGYYGILLFCLGGFWWWRDTMVAKVALSVVSAGLLCSAGFVYLQVFVIGAICEYCLASAIFTFVIWIGTFLLVRAARPATIES